MIWFRREGKSLNFQFTQPLVGKVFVCLEPEREVSSDSFSRVSDRLRTVGSVSLLDTVEQVGDFETQPHFCLFSTAILASFVLS